MRRLSIVPIVVPLGLALPINAAAVLVVYTFKATLSVVHVLGTNGALTVVALVVKSGHGELYGQVATRAICFGLAI